MRLFIAIRFTGKMKKALTDLEKNLKRQGVSGNFTDEDNLHLTLAFIGESDEAARISRILRSVPIGNMSLSFSRLGNYGNLYWIGLQSSPELRAYVNELRNALAENGIPFDRRPFRPHITLVRRASVRKKPEIRIPAVRMTVRSVSLMKSERIDGRMRYTEIASAAKPS